MAKKKQTPQQIQTAKEILEAAGYVCVRSMFQKDDIIERAKEREIKLTRKQIDEVANLMEKRHDCNNGVNWDFIDYCTDEIIE